MEDDPVLFVQSANEVTKFPAQYAFHRPPVRRHDMYLYQRHGQTERRMDRWPDKGSIPWSEAPRYLIRDRDGVYGAVVTRRIRAMGIRDQAIAAGSPWQNAYAERLIGTNQAGMSRPR
jgi:hypothetical protein